MHADESKNKELAFVMKAFNQPFALEFICVNQGLSAFETKELTVKQSTLAAVKVCEGL